MSAVRAPSSLRLAGVLIVVGLAVQVITLLWAHPTAFLTFIAFGGGLVGLGVLRYLLDLLALSAASRGGGAAAAGSSDET